MRLTNRSKVMLFQDVGGFANFIEGYCAEMSEVSSFGSSTLVNLTIDGMSSVLISPVHGALVLLIDVVG